MVDLSIVMLNYQRVSIRECVSKVPEVSATSVAFRSFEFRFDLDGMFHVWISPCSTGIKLSSMV